MDSAIHAKVINIGMRAPVNARTALMERFIAQLRELVSALQKSLCSIILEIV